MKNIELKIKVDSLNELKKEADKMGADFEDELMQIDTYYNFKKGRLKIREINEDCAEIIFYQRPDLSKSKISDCKIIKIKSKNLNYFKNDFNLKHGIKVVVEKKRDLWIYKNTRIHFDKVKKLGNFLELETIVKDGIKEAQKEFNEVVNFLNLDKHKKCKYSYSDMLLK